MVKYELFNLFHQDNINKQAKIEYSGGVMTNVELFQNSEELSESLCSESELRFGCCEASCLKFKVANIVKPLVGEWVTYSLIVNNREDIPFLVGRYKVVSDKRTADRMHREIVAYDFMYDILNANVATWYNAIFLDNVGIVTMKRFRESFIRHFGLTEVVPKGGLVNDSMTVEKTIEPEEISGKDVITAICEINGCFGHIGRDGKFHYIYLPQAIQGLYPANDLYPDHAPDYLPYQQKKRHLYPQDPKGTKIGRGLYIHCDYEDFVTQDIHKIQIRQEENDIGLIYGSGNNCYIIQDNFLVYGKSSEDLERIARSLYSKISNISYRPINSLDARGNPCFEVGDPIRLTTRYDIVESYILKRTLKGVQALRDNYSASGILQYSEKVNSVHKSIIQLKGKANILTRTLEETTLEMYDIEKGLNHTISITASGLEAKITEEKIRAENEETKLSHNIQVTAEGLRADIVAESTRAEEEERKLSNNMQVTAEKITADLKDEVVRATGEERNLHTIIGVTAEQLNVNITEESKRAQEEELNLATSIIAMAGTLVLKVDANGKMAIVELNADPNTGTEFKVNAGNIALTAEEAINLMAGGTLNLTGKNIAITSDNFSVDAQGNMECHNITAFSISGDAVNQFSSAVEDTEALEKANEAIRKAQNSLDVVLEVIKNLNDTIIPEINQTINDLQVDVAAIDARVSAL